MLLNLDTAEDKTAKHSRNIFSRQQVKSTAIKKCSQLSMDSDEADADFRENGGVLCLPLQRVTMPTICEGIHMIQSVVNSIPQEGSRALRLLGKGAVESLQLLRDMYRLRPGQAAFDLVVSNARTRVIEFGQYFADAVRDNPELVNRWPEIFAGVPLQHRPRHNDNRVVPRAPDNNEPQHHPVEPPPSPPPEQPRSQPPPEQPRSQPPPEQPRSQPPPEQPRSQPPPEQPRSQPPPEQPRSQPPPEQPPNLPPRNGTLDQMLAATKQMLEYVWAHKWWIITGVAGVGVGAVAAATCGPPVVAAVAAGTVISAGKAAVVGGITGGVAGLGIKTTVDKCTQRPPHEHQD